MKFKSQVFTETSGSVGGLTFSHNRGGLYTRARSIPTDPASAFQTVLRGFMGQLASRWRDDLTPAERTAWDEYAAATLLLDRLGEPRNVGGMGMYQRGNVPRLQSGVAEGIIDDGPIVDGLPSVSAVVVSASAPTTIGVEFNILDEWVGEAGAAMMVFTSVGKSPGINFFKGPYRFAGSIEGDPIVPPTSPATLVSPFVLSVGDRLFSRVTVFDDEARYSLTQFLSTIVTA